MMIWFWIGVSIGFVIGFVVAASIAVAIAIWVTRETPERKKKYQKIEALTDTAMTCQRMGMLDEAQEYIEESTRLLDELRESQ